jgi:hypothetical protein
MFIPRTLWDYSITNSVRLSLLIGIFPPRADCLNKANNLLVRAKKTGPLLITINKTGHSGKHIPVMLDFGREPKLHIEIMGLKEGF